MTQQEKNNDIIRSTDDLRRVLREAGLPHIPIFEVPEVKLPQISDQDKRKIQLECIRQARDGKGKK